MEYTLSNIKSALSAPDAVRKVTLQDTLDAAFSDQESSHAVAFAYRPDGSFEGIVFAAQLLFQKRYPPGTKVKSAVLHPPRISLSTPVAKVAELMAATGAYTLPVFDEYGKEILYSVNARMLLRRAARDADMFREMLSHVAYDAALTAPLSASVEEVFHMLRDQGRSRVLLVDERGKLKALVARRDLQHLFMKPSTEQSVVTERGGGRGNTLGTQKRPRLDGAIRSFAKSKVNAVSAKTSRETIVRTLLASRYNSIALLDAASRPVGMVSVRTLLRALAAVRSEEGIPIQFRNDAKLPQGDVAFLRDMVEGFAAKLHKREPLMRIDIRVKESRNKAGRPTMFEVLIQCFKARGGKFVAETKKKDLKPAFQEVMQEITKQQRRSGKR